MKPPIKNLVLLPYPAGSMTQGFGENPNLYGRWGLAGHNGIDIVAPHGEPMYAIEDARVMVVHNSPDGFGKYVRLRSLSSTKGVYREWTYGHCSTIYAREGRNVTAGTHIADMGNTGFVVSGATPYWKHNPYAGTHLHLGLRQLVEDAKDGWRYPGDTMRIRILNYNNGYKGSIDPLPFLTFPPSQQRQQLLTMISLLNTIIRLYKKKQEGIL